MKKIFPYSSYFIPVVILTLIGIADSIYLTINHYKNFTDLTYNSFCALSKSINCDTVAQSPYSIFFGLPMAIWGTFGYCLFFALLVFVRKQDCKNMATWSLLLLLSFSFCLFSIYLGYISATKIHSYCIMCLISYAVSFSLFFYCFLIRYRFYKHPFVESIRTSFSCLFINLYFIVFLSVLIIILIAGKMYIPHYWDYASVPLSTNIRNDFTIDGHPWIGAEKPILTVEEYADYECFQCYKMHFFLRRLVEQYPDKIRLIHRNYPMDNSVNPVIVPEPFHVGAGKMALLAIFAATQGKFWEVNDMIYDLARKKEPFNTRTLAQKTGIPTKDFTASLYSPEIKNLLTRDIWQGMKLRIMSTPAFVIDGKIYLSNIPPEILNPVLQ
jgi:uncharacterized membrane protein/protein-disulfide isomerase